MAQQGRRDFVKYSFFKVSPEWRRLPPGERQYSKSEFADMVAEFSDRVTMASYSLVGTRGDADFMLWMISPTLEAVNELLAQLNRTELGKFLGMSHSYLAMTRPSEYFGKNRDPEPVGSKYLFVYPFTKKREWYSLPFEERQRMMKQHVQIGHKYPSVTIHTAYSFGLDDYEFILSFETDHPEDFLSLVMDLRSSEASKYTAVETPIFTCISASPERMLDLLGP